MGKLITSDGMPLEVRIRLSKAAQRLASTANPDTIIHINAETWFTLDDLRQVWSSLSPDERAWVRQDELKESTARAAEPSILDGDGRQNLYPPDDASGFQPMPIRRSAARQVAAAFLSRGQTTHSALGHTVWIVETICKELGIPYDICEVQATPEATTQPPMGYVVRRLDRLV